MRILTTLDARRLIEVLLACWDWTSQISYNVVASLLRAQSFWAALMSLYSIAAEYNGPLEAAHAHIDDDRYDKVN